MPNPRQFQWPTPEELGDLVVAVDRKKRPPRGRVLLGRLAATDESPLARMLKLQDRATPPLASEWCRGVLVIGATRTGKTSSVLAPAVINWDGPVITTSIRGDVLGQTQRWRKKAGWPVLVYQPKLEAKYRSHTWSPVSAAMGEKPWVGARRMADVLIEASGLAEGGANRHDPFWTAAAALYLGPLLLAAAQLGPSMEPVMRWLHTSDQTGLLDDGTRAYKTREEIHKHLLKYPAALRVAEGVWALHERTRSSIYLTARTALAAYDDPDVLETCGTGGPRDLPEITAETVLGTEDTPGATLYLVCPATNRKSFAPLFSALLTSILEAAYSRSVDGLVPERPILLALDEVANIAPIAELPGYASTAAGAGMQLITVLQDLGQAERIWGSAGTRTLLTNHPAKLILGGTTDSETLKWVQEMFGDVEVSRFTESRNQGPSFETSRGVSWTAERRPLLNGDEIRRLPLGGGLLVYGRERAAIVRLTPETTI